MNVYGIPNCNSVKKAIDWLKNNGQEISFHDFKKKGITADKLKEWCEEFGWEKVLNKKGTTWKKLTPEEQATVTDQQSAIAVMLKNTSAIKRPVIENSSKAVVIGFDETEYDLKLK